MMEWIARRPVFSALVGYLSVMFVYGVVDGYRNRRAVERRLAEFRNDLDSRREYIALIARDAIAAEPENARRD